MSILDRLIDNLVGPVPIWPQHHQPYPQLNDQPTFVDFKKLFTKKEERSQYFLIDGTVVKVVIMAEKNEYNGRGSITCQITEKNGLAVSAETIEATKTVLEVREDQDVQAEDQKMLLTGLFDAFGFKGRPIPVSESYVEGHVKHLELLARVTNKGAR